MNSITYTPFGQDYSCVMNGWEPKENEDGVIYFSNSKRRVTSWTHPFLDKVLGELSEYNEIRYAAYRTAMKLRYLQQNTGLSWITLRGIKKVLMARREAEESYRETFLSHKEAFNVIVSILEASGSFCPHKTHFVNAADIIVNLLIELYDTNYEGKFALSSLKISLAALCSAQLSEKYRFFYSEMFNFDEQTLQRERLLYFFYDLMQITEFLKESIAFGTNVSLAVDSCLNHYMSPEESGRSSEDAFYSWLLLEPQIIVWLPTLHRVAATEKVVHDVRCSSCGIDPLKGFRYRCLQCFKYDLCQKCFFQGNVSLTHKLKHPVQEYCLPASRKDNTKAVFKIMRNKLSKKHRSRSKITYLPLDDDSITGCVLQWQPRHTRFNPREHFLGSKDSGLAQSSENETAVSVDTPVHVHEGNTRIIVNAEREDVDQLSRKEMLDQQDCMAKKIEELQEENKLLQERLQLLTQQKASDYCSNNHTDDLVQSIESESIKTEQNPMLQEYHSQSIQGPEDLNPIIISAIEPESIDDSQSLKEERDNSKPHNDESNSENSIPDVMEIVGYYTPVRSSFNENHSRPKREAANDLSNVLEDKALKIISNEKSNECLAVCEPLKVKEEEEMKLDINSIPESDAETNTVSEKDDPISESTASGLEYGYSDMSLHSESLSQKSALKGKEALASVGLVHEKEEAYQCLEINSSFENQIEPVVKGPMTEPKLENPTSCSEITKVKHHNNNFYQLHNNDMVVGIKEDGIVSPPEGPAASLSQTTELNTNEAFCNISDILPDGSNLPVLNDISNKPSTPDNGQLAERRLTLEPVFMSTPVVQGGQAEILKTNNKPAKENEAPYGNNKQHPLQLIALYRCRAQNGVTPRSAVLSMQNKRLATSRENLSPKCQSVELSHRDVGMTTMFDKVERLGDLETTNLGESLIYRDKEEMERLVRKLDSTDSSPDYHQVKTRSNSSSSSMLNAVLNVGDAMADLVQATAEAKQK